MKIKFEENEVKMHIDGCIKRWIKLKAKGVDMADAYVDVYQSMRETLFGEKLRVK